MRYKWHQGKNIYKLPYDGAKEMLSVNNVDSEDFLIGLFKAMFDKLPAQKLKKEKAQ
ncbi:hypothetical protein [Treponema pedis]|uniref:Uncharacterized protein n=1 Tax=Treponema pedis TaxID=409322 RepID=A0A7S6WS09_9SPIR|nr:hypothetical protein IFE08_02780 [Treponema pedis]